MGWITAKFMFLQANVQGICPFLGRTALFKAALEKLYAGFDTVETAFSETTAQLLDSFALELIHIPA